jgi:hypothetical protein
MKASHESRRRVSRLLLLCVACALGLFCSEPLHPCGEDQLLSRRQGDVMPTRAGALRPVPLFARGL